MAPSGPHRRWSRTRCRAARRRRRAPPPAGSPRRSRSARPRARSDPARPGTRPRGTVAKVRGAGAGELGLGLARLGQDAGIALPAHLRADQRPGGPRPRPGRWPVDRHPPAEGIERRAEASGSATRTSGPRCARTASPARAGSANSASRPSACRMAKASGTGVRAMSEPRTFRSQAMESGRVSTAAARSLATSPRATRPAFRPSSARPAPPDAADRPGRRGRLIRPRAVERFETRTRPT